MFTAQFHCESYCKVTTHEKTCLCREKARYFFGTPWCPSTLSLLVHLARTIIPKQQASPARDSGTVLSSLLFHTVTASSTARFKTKYPICRQETRQQAYHCATPASPLIWKKVTYRQDKEPISGHIHPKATFFPFRTSLSRHVYPDTARDVDTSGQKVHHTAREQRGILGNVLMCQDKASEKTDDGHLSVHEG